MTEDDMRKIVEKLEKERWRYPNKGELPEDNRLCVVDFGDEDYGVCKVKDGRFWDNDYGWLEFEDAIAWRYIEPPKEEI